ncbi:MAG: NADH-quinone oxidoreductase subunit NuoE [Calditrichia bacterium]
MLTKDEISEIDEHLKLYPHKRAACIEALKIVQKHRRWISDESLQDLAIYLDMTAEELDSVATFYNLVFRKPVGRHVILICDSVSCWILGYEQLLSHLNEKLGIKLGETTSDDRFTLLPIPCLGTCDHAPALMIDDDLHRDLTPEKLDKILEEYQ